MSYLIWLAFWGKKDLYPAQAGAGTLSLLKLKLRCPGLGPRSTCPSGEGDPQQAHLPGGTSATLELDPQSYALPGTSSP